MIRPALLALALALSFSGPASAKSRCMGVNKTLCAFARAHNLKIISGYRKNACIAGTRGRSLHASGQAMDVYNCGRRCIRAARARKFGLGFYRGRFKHIHISNGARERNVVFYRGYRKQARKHRRYARR